MPVRLRPEDPFYCRTQYPGDDVASSIQACEACRVGASPTHLTNFVPDGASEPLGLQNRCDGSVTRGHVQFLFHPSAKGLWFVPIFGSIISNNGFDA